jgi:hypothetical protein
MNAGPKSTSCSYLPMRTWTTTQSGFRAASPTFSPDADPGTWHFIYRGVLAGNGDGDPISPEKAARISEAFTLPYSYSRIRLANLYDDAAFCAAATRLIAIATGTCRTQAAANVPRATGSFWTRTGRPTTDPVRPARCLTKASPGRPAWHRLVGRQAEHLRMSSRPLLVV